MKNYTNEQAEYLAGDIFNFCINELEWFEDVNYDEMEIYELLIERDFENDVQRRSIDWKCKELLEINGDYEYDIEEAKQDYNNNY